jgi:hypothetical protein
LLKAKTKAVYASYKDRTDGKPKLAVGVVTQYPKEYSWHLDYYGEEDKVVDHNLKALEKRKTQLDMAFHNKWKIGIGPSQEAFQKK